MLDKICYRCFCPFNPSQKRGWLNCICGVYKLEKSIITLEAYLSSSGKYKDRLDSPELTEQVKDNAVILLNKVNQLLDELKITKVTVSSGFRPSAVNAATKGAAKKSLHMTGHAIDIVDIDNKLGKLILTQPELLKKYGLWMEDISATPTWCHLDISTTRKDRELRVFKV